MVARAAEEVFRQRVWGRYTDDAGSVRVNGGRGPEQVDWAVLDG